MPSCVVGDNAWFGTVWVDRGSFQLLRVEAYDPESHENRLALEKAREKSHHLAVTVTEHGSHDRVGEPLSDKSRPIAKDIPWVGYP